MKRVGLGFSGIIRPYSVAGVIGWTLLIAAIFGYDIHEHDQEVVAVLRNAARAAISKDVMYRRWNAELGGVYGEVSETLQPNPFLAHVPERDITTPSGRRLTLINPSYMTRLVHAAERKTTDTASHLTGLRPMRAENAPDDWEAGALQAMETGAGEVSEVVRKNGNSFLRLMQPLVAEQVCLDCHGTQGYGVGQLLGGISVTLPVRSFFELFDETLAERVGVFGLIWGVGVLITLVGSARISRSTAALQESERKYRELFGAMRDGMYIADGNGIIEFLNPAGARLFGYDNAHDALGISLDEFWADTHERAAFSKDLKANTVLNLRQVRMKTKDGAPRMVEVSSSLSFDESGAATREEGTFRDVTSRVEANAKVREMYDTMQKIIDHAPFGIYLIDERGDIEYSNPAILQILGDAPGRTATENVFHVFGEENEVLRERLRDGLSGNGFALETISCSSAAQERTMICNFYGVPLVERGKNKLLVIVEDISRRVDAERRQTELHNQLLQSQKIDSLGHLAGGIAHDFNNVLSIIIGYCDLMLLDVPEGGALAENLNAIRAAGDKAASIAHQLLAFSRKQVLEMDVISVNDIIRNIGKMLKRFIGEDIQLEITTTDAESTIYADATQIEQVLINLAVNARDAMPRGGTFSVATDNVLFIDETVPRKEMTPGRYVRISVSDTGHGMSPEIAERIFEPFFTTKERGHGTGLGLATVYGIVKQHNGYVHVTSEVDTGTTFLLYLPLVQSGAAEKSSRRQESSMPRGSATILVAEDDEAVRRLVTKVLATLGYTVLQAANGPEALKVAEEYGGDIHILLTDVIMPTMNGKELSDLLQISRPSMKTIFLSGYSEEVLGRRGILGEGITYLRKPVTPSALAAKVAETAKGFS